MKQASFDDKPSGYAYVVCLLIFLSYMFVFFHRLCPAVIALDMQEAFGVSGTLLGVLGSAYFYPYAVMQIPTGLLADSWGPRKTVSVFFLLAAAGAVLMGIAPSLTVAIIGRVLVGFGVSTVFVCNFKLIAEWFNPRRFVIMGGMFMTVGGLGAISSSAPLAWISDLIGWRMSLVTVGGTTLILATLLYAFVRDRPSDIGLPSPSSVALREGSGSIGLTAGIRLVVSSGRFWMISAWAFLAVGTSFAVGGLWGGPYLMHVYGLSKTEAGGVLSMFSVALIIGSPTLSWFANRVGRKPVLIACSLFSMTASGTCYALTEGLPPQVLYVLFFLFCLSGAASGPVVAAVSKELFPLNIAGTAVGAVNLFPFFGAAIFQIVAGAIVSRGAPEGGVYPLGGYQDMFLFLLVGGAIAFLVALFLTETLHRTESHPEHSMTG